VEGLIRETSALRDRADAEMRLEKYFAGMELTTRYLPPVTDSESIARNELVRALYRQKVPTETTAEGESPTEAFLLGGERAAATGEMTEVLEKWKNDTASAPHLHDSDRPREVAAKIDEILRQRARAYFGPLVQQSVWDLLKEQSRGDQALKDQM